jgi:quercetin dioxygenase-like cupin family protein
LLCDTASAAQSRSVRATHGELTLWVGGEVIVAPAGSYVYGPRDIPHTFLVTSAPEARFLMVTEPGPFADFVRAMSEPARTHTLPPTSVQPPTPNS